MPAAPRSVAPSVSSDNGGSSFDLQLVFEMLRPTTRDTRLAIDGDNATLFRCAVSRFDIEELREFAPYFTGRADNSIILVLVTGADKAVGARETEEVHRIIEQYTEIHPDQRVFLGTIYSADLLRSSPTPDDVATDFARGVKQQIEMKRASDLHREMELRRQKVPHIELSLESILGVSEIPDMPVPSGSQFKRAALSANEQSDDFNNSLRNLTRLVKHGIDDPVAANALVARLFSLEPRVREADEALVRQMANMNAPDEVTAISGMKDRADALDNVHKQLVRASADEYKDKISKHLRERYYAEVQHADTEAQRARHARDELVSGQRAEVDTVLQMARRSAEEDQQRVDVYTKMTESVLEQYQRYVQLQANLYFKALSERFEPDRVVSGRMNCLKDRQTEQRREYEDSIRRLDSEVKKVREHVYTAALGDVIRQLDSVNMEDLGPAKTEVHRQVQDGIQTIVKMALV
jgi:hypothetical protein